MKAGKKITAGAQKRTKHHNEASAARQKKQGSVQTPGSFKAPGSRNKKKTGVR